jgi:eukaryotic-like serine/threonine-protein kinase
VTQTERVLGGRYRLLNEIARGGMATVWRAEDTLLDRQVAVKVLHPQFVGDPEFLERFRREARAAARLSHPNIVPIYDVGEDSGIPYIVMELVEGGNLKDRIRAAAPLPDAEIRSIGATLAATLDYAHGKGIIHRDVKPQNVLLGEDGRPRLTDFGIAQAMASSGLTRTGAVMGSVHYIAPEMVRGKTASPASDVYSLGAVLYEMATGRVPFQGETDLAVALAHVEQTPASPRALNARLAPDLEATILAKAPDLRYPSAAAFGQSLRSRAAAPGPAVSEVTRRMAVPAAAPLAGTQRLPAQAAAPSAVAQRRAANALAASAGAAPFARRTARPRGRGASNGMVGLLVALAAVLIALGAGFYGLATLSRQGFAPPPGPTPAPTAVPTAPPKPVAVPTNTPVPPPTATPQPSDTPVPPTATPAPPTPTAVPPSPTPAPPTPAPRTIAVPQLRGKTLDQAQAMLSQMGLTVTVRGVNVNVDKNVVADQSPDVGAALPPGGTVALSVGTGSTTIPEVLNLPRDQAVRTLQNNSFRPILRDQRDPRIPAGSAAGTKPPAGTVLARGSDVELDISSGR